MHYTHVHRPIQIGRVEIPNRIVRTAHVTNLGGGTMTDALIAYHAARAHGGVGMSIVETLAVHPSAPKSINIFAPDVADGYRKLVDTVRPLGMRLFQQLWHGGHNALPADGSAPWSASDIASPAYGAVPVPMTREMIDVLIESFATAAAKCAAWGLDGIEINAAHGYIFAQFLSANYNRREDDYGGPFENRARLLLDTLKAVRSCLPAGFPLGARLSIEPETNGISVNDHISLARMLEEERLIDYLSVSLGNYNSLNKILGAMHEPMGYQLPETSQVTRAVSLPTIVTGRFRTLEEADQVIRSGDADMISMVRATIADPNLVRKSLSGKPDQARPCIACNQGCIGGLYRPPFRLGCAVNPGVGQDDRIGDDYLAIVERPRRIMVVGGGPAGLEAARVARLRGHDVTLFEATAALGGMAGIAARAPTRHGFADIVKWQEAEIFRLGVDVRLSSYVEPDDVASEAPDAVIIATGSLPRMDGIQLSNPGEPIVGMNLPHVMSSTDVMTGSPVDALHAVVIDDVGHYEAVAVTEMLLARGCTVSYVSRLPSFAADLEGIFVNNPALARLHGYDAGFLPLLRHRAVEITLDAVFVAPVFLPAPDRLHRIEAQLVVVVTHNRPNRDLANMLAADVREMHVVGDAQMPRTIQQAIKEGYAAGAHV